MDNKQEINYYTPTLYDLREGFKFELQVYDEETDEYIDEWEQHEFDVRSGLDHDEYHTFTDGRVRAITEPISNVITFKDMSPEEVEEMIKSAGVFLKLSKK